MANRIPVSVEGGDPRWVDIPPGPEQRETSPAGRTQWSPDRPRQRGQDVQRAPGYEHWYVTIKNPERPA